MNLSEKNVFIQLYSWMFGITQWELHKKKNLCPIFWMTILSLVLAVPYFIICLPVMLYEAYTKLKGNYDLVDTFGTRIGKAVVGWIITGILYIFTYTLLVMLGWADLRGLDGLVRIEVIFTSLLLLMLITFTATYGVMSIRDYYSNKRTRKNRANADELGIPYREYVEPLTTVGVIIEYTKASYHKYCPQITWVNNKQ